MNKIALAALALICTSSLAQTQNFSSEDLARRTIERRAVEAAIWGMPLVNTDAMRQAYFRDVGAKYNDICYFSKPQDWKFQVTTPNASTNYIYFNYNLKDGPVVVEIPAAVDAGLLGSMVDAWDEPMTDIGPAGEDQGKGGKYLLLPPDFKGDTPSCGTPKHVGYRRQRSGRGDLPKHFDRSRWATTHWLQSLFNTLPEGRAAGGESLLVGHFVRREAQLG
jgi:hypothetical protein